MCLSIRQVLVMNTNLNALVKMKYTHGGQERGTPVRSWFGASVQLVMLGILSKYMEVLLSFFKYIHC